MSKIVCNTPIIVALDYSCADQAMACVSQLTPQLCRLKVGKELFVAAGPLFVKQLIKLGFDVFLDLKFHDIPTTVAKAVRVAADLGVWMVNVHASGGGEMLAAAYDALAKKEKKPYLIGVTVLTSMKESDLIKLGHSHGIEAQVSSLAQMCEKAHLDGVVCSALEAKLLRKSCRDDFLLVTPGIRLATDKKDDQHRITTPQQALVLGSDYLVIGRSITQAKNPVQVLERIAISCQ